jgi:hypothetical protein
VVRRKMLQSSRVFVLMVLLVFALGLSGCLLSHLKDDDTGGGDLLNLLVNGSFEEGVYEEAYLDQVPNEWTWEYNYDQSGSFWVTDEEAYDGANSVKVVAMSKWRNGDTTWGEVSHLYQEQVLEPDKTYTIIAYVKHVQGDSTQATLGLILKDINGDQNQYYSSGRTEVIGGGTTAAQGDTTIEITEASDGWEKHRIVFTTPVQPISTYLVRLGVWGSSPDPQDDNIAYFDKVQLYEGDVR